MTNINYMYATNFQISDRKLILAVITYLSDVIQRKVLRHVFAGMFYCLEVSNDDIVRMNYTSELLKDKF